MENNKFFAALLCVLLISWSGMQCSRDTKYKETVREKSSRHSIETYNEIMKEREKREQRIRKEGKEDEAVRKKQLAVVERCSDRFNSCVAKCDGPDCEDACLHALSVCEKDVPLGLKTLKE
jgi:hypothetical protein